MRVTAFLLSLFVVATMAALSGYTASSWSDLDAADRATFGATAGMWALALVALALAGRSRRPLLFGLAAALFALTLVGEAWTLVAVSIRLE